MICVIRSLNCKTFHKTKINKEYGNNNVKRFFVSKVLEYLYSDIVFIQIIKFLYTM